MRRRQAVGHVCEVLSVSERRACRVLGQVRRTQRYTPRVGDEEVLLSANIVSLASHYGRYGYRRITAMLRADGWGVNHKRVERIWRQEGLKVPARQPKRGRLWLNDGSCIRLRPEHRNHVWAYDFVFDRTHEGRPLKLLNVVDEFTRECLTIDVARKQSSRDVLRALARLMLRHGIPKHIRSDNGPEFVAKAVRKWLSRLGVETLFIEPGSPWENGYIESFNGKLRDELLNGEIFTTLQEAKVLTDSDFPGVRGARNVLRLRPRVVSEVFDVLDMWSFIERGYAKLSEKDKKRVESEAAPLGNDVTFRGFDGNNESDHYSVALFLINDMGRFNCFKDRDLNSHFPSINDYRRMLAVFEPMRKTLVGRALSASQIINLQKARMGGQRW